jgi:hypothetical protein
MNKRYLLSFVVSLYSLSYGQSQSPTCFCCTEAHQQFDFWIGTWEVFDTTGTLIGENTILPVQDHCILQENWKSRTTTGSSYNYFDASDSSWNQVWMDNRGNPLVLKGAFKGGKMIMRDKLNAASPPTYNQITWAQNPDGSVTQSWEVFNEQGKRVSLLFKGVYKKK